MELWLEARQPKDLRALLIILCWGVWITHNNSIFKGLLTPLAWVAVEELAILNHFAKYVVVVPSQNVVVIKPDQSCPWGFFDGSSQGEDLVCGGGSIFFINAQHFYHVQMRLGRGSNNWAEINACWTMITFVVD